MSVIIKGIDKPKACVSCMFTYLDENSIMRCNFCDEDIDLKNDCVLDECPVCYAKQDHCKMVCQSNQWITDRLPSESGKYLVTGKWKDKPSEIWICEFLCLSIMQGWCNPCDRPTVKAWMPLPTSYYIE